MIRILVAQIGARRHYAVPRGLAAVDALEVFATDACANAGVGRGLQRVPEECLPHSLRALRARLVEGVETKRIVTLSLGAFLKVHWPKHLREARSEVWSEQNRRFCVAVRGKNWEEVDAVYAFNGAALEIFQEAKRRGLRCLLDQTAAPWRWNTELLRAEQTKYPDWEETPDDVDPVGVMINREEQEWQLADRIICGSTFVQAKIAAVGGPEGKCRVVPYPIPDWGGLPAAARIPRGPRQPLRALFLGTLELRKGIQYVYEAAQRLDPARVHWRAVGPLRLTGTAARRLETRVELNGPVPRAQVGKHYAWADVFVLPTLSEGSANVCLEAMAAGLPVITTAAAGLPHQEGLVHQIALHRGAEPLVDRLASFFHQPRDVLLPAAVSVPMRSIADYGADLLAAIRP